MRIPHPPINKIGKPEATIMEKAEVVSSSLASVLNGNLSYHISQAPAPPDREWRNGVPPIRSEDRAPEHPRNPNVHSPQDPLGGIPVSWGSWLVQLPGHSQSNLKSRGSQAVWQLYGISVFQILPVISLWEFWGRP